MWGHAMRGTDHVRFRREWGCRTLRAGACAALAFALSLAATGRGATTDGLRFTLPVPLPVLEMDADGRQVIRIEGFTVCGAPGQPLLPSKTIHLLLPPDADTEHVTLNVAAAFVPLPNGPFELAAAGADATYHGDQLVEDWGRAARIVDGRDLDVYEADAIFPLSAVERFPAASLRKWRFVAVRVTPVRYHPPSGRVDVASKVEITLSFARSPRVLTADQAALNGDTVMDDVARELFANYETAAGAYEPGQATAVPLSETRDFVIITTQAISLFASKFPDFVAHKEALGYRVRVVTESEYDLLAGQAPNQRADRIRRWLMNHYVSLGIRYVLLIGDPQPGSTGLYSVPMKSVWPQRVFNSSAASSVPTDAYYADLTGNWDSDGDGFYGEGFDDWGVDFAAEVWVGRLPIYSAQELAGLNTMLQSIMDYENAIEAEWRFNALLPMSFMSPGMDGGSLGAQLIVDVLFPRGFDTWRMYQKGSGPGGISSTYACDQELFGPNVVRDRWAANPPGIVCWLAHGSPTTAAVGYDGYWNEDNLLASWQTGWLDNRTPAFAFLASCLNGYPEEENNLQASLMRRGCIGVAAASRVSYFYTTSAYGGYPGSADIAGMAYEFTKRVAMHRTAGRALAETRQTVRGAVTGLNMLSNLHTFNFYGDPSLSLQTCSMPYVLRDNTPESFRRDAVPKPFRFFTNAGDWSVVALAATTNFSLTADDDPSLTSPYGASTDLVNGRPFVVLNGHQLGAGPRAARVGGLLHLVTDYTIEAQWTPIALAVNQYRTFQAAANSVVHLFEIPLTAGKRYRFETGDQNNPAYDEMFIFRPNREWGSRQVYDLRSTPDSKGRSQPIEFTALESGTYGIVLIHDSRTASGRWIQVGEVSPLPAVQNVQASDGVYANHVRVTWDALPEADCYEVRRYWLGGNTPILKVLTNSFVGTVFDDWTAEAEGVYEYQVKGRAQATATVWRESVPGLPDTGFINPPFLSDDVAEINEDDFRLYRLIPGSPAGWQVAGVRATKDKNIFHLGLYTDGAFDQRLAMSDTPSLVNFVVVDGHHAPAASPGRGVLARYADGYPLDCVLEYEGAGETLAVGTNLVSWPAGDVVEMWDVPLVTGRYAVALEYLSGSADLDMALFSSRDGKFFRNRNAYLARSASAPGGSNEMFYVTIDANDTYGLCVWANDGLTAQVRLVIQKLREGEWEGNVSDDWHEPLNWSDVQVPSYQRNVMIPAGVPHMPRIGPATAYCRDLTLEPGASFEIGPNLLFAHGNVTVRGDFSMTHSNAHLIVYGLLAWEAGGTAAIHPSAQITCEGNWAFAPGAKIVLNPNTVRFKGPGESWILCEDPDSRFHDVILNKNNGVVLFHWYSSAPLRVNSLTIEEGTTFESYAGAAVIVDTWLNSPRGHYKWKAGSLVFAGNPGSVTLKHGYGDQLHDLVIRAPYTVRLGTRDEHVFRVTGDVVIEQGALDAGAWRMEVGGDWSNAVGEAGFLADTSTVAFVGFDGIHRLWGDTRFHNVEQWGLGRSGIRVYDHVTVENRLTALKHVEVYDRLTVNGVLDLDYHESECIVFSNAVANVAAADLGGAIRVWGGQMTVGDIVDNGLRGVFDVTGGALDLHQGTTAGNGLNLAGHIAVSGGRMTVHGGWSDIGLWAQDGPAGLQLSGGVLEFADQGIWIYPSVHAYSNTVSGGTLRLGGDLRVGRSGIRMDGSEVRLTGAAKGWINLLADTRLHDLTIDKTDGAAVQAISPVHVERHFTLAQGAFLPHEVFHVGGNWSNAVGAGAFDPGFGTVVFDGATDAGISSPETFRHVQILKSGTPEPARLRIGAGHDVTILGDLDIAGGWLESGAGSGLDVGGHLLVRAGGGLDLQAAGARLTCRGDWVNENSALTASGGFAAGSSATVTFAGPGSALLHSAALLERFPSIVVNKPGGELRPSLPLWVNGSLRVTEGAWSYAAEGLSHSVAGDFAVEAAAAWSDQTAGSRLRLAGSANQTVRVDAEGASFRRLELDKLSESRVTLFSNLDVLGGEALTILGGVLDLNGRRLRSEGNLDIHPRGRLVVNGNGRLEIGNGRLLNVAGGTLEAVTYAGHEIMLTRMDGHFGVLIHDNGMLRAENANFQFLSSNGVHIAADGWIDPDYPLNGCTFAEGVPGGALVTVDNAQTLKSYRVAFPARAPTAAANVRKRSNTGRLVFQDAAGSFAGEEYDDDPFDRVDWTVGVMQSVRIEGPPVVTRGGVWSFAGVAEPADCTHPVSFVWDIDDIGTLEGMFDEGRYTRRCEWKEAGLKEMTIVVSNPWGVCSTAFVVDVQNLHMADIARTAVGGTNACVVTIGGTCTQGLYRLDFRTNLLSGEWAPAGPSLPGQPGRTEYMDTGDDQWGVDAIPRRFYRAVMPGP